MLARNGSTAARSGQDRMAPPPVCSALVNAANPARPLTAKAAVITGTWARPTHQMAPTNRARTARVPTRRRTPATPCWARESRAAGPIPAPLRLSTA